METFDNNQDRIDRYLNDSMSIQEKNDFEHDMTFDQELAAQYNYSRTMQRTIREAALAERWQKLQQHASQPRKSSNKNLYTIVIIGLLMISGIIIYNSWTNSSEKSIKNPSKGMDTLDEPTDTFPENLIKDTIINKPPLNNRPTSGNDGYADLAQKLFINPELLTLVVRGGEEDKIYHSLADDYKQGYYEEALRGLQRSERQGDKEQYLKAHCLYKMNKWSEAATIFSTFAQDEYNDFYQESTLYLALCYLHLMPQSKPLLLALSEEQSLKNGRHQSAFRQILKVLK